MRGMTVERIANSREYQSLVADYRSMCLWSMPDCSHPSSLRQIDCVLRSIENYGDLAAYKRAGRIRQWLSPHSSPKSCV